LELVFDLRLFLFFDDDLWVNNTTKINTARNTDIEISQGSEGFDGDAGGVVSNCPLFDGG